MLVASRVYFYYHVNITMHPLLPVQERSFYRLKYANIILNIF